MTPVFADTSFYVAAINPFDSLHAKATAVAGALRGPIVTTVFVLLEVANFLSKVKYRPLFTGLVRNLRAAPDIEIVPASPNCSRLRSSSSTPGWTKTGRSPIAPRSWS
jgi:hypothetical protein